MAESSPGESLALSLSCERGEERRGKERRKEDLRLDSGGAPVR
jgi:hypothetical protein